MKQYEEWAIPFDTNGFSTAFIYFFNFLHIESTKYNNRKQEIIYVESTAKMHLDVNCINV